MECRLGYHGRVAATVWVIGLLDAIAFAFVHGAAVARLAHRYARGATGGDWEEAESSEVFWVSGTKGRCIRWKPACCFRSRCSAWLMSSRSIWELATCAWGVASQPWARRQQERILA